MLGRARDLRCRLLSVSLHVANLHLGWHWDPAALARWTSMMPFSSRLVQELVHAARRT
jgi:hypothetical protein